MKIKIKTKEHHPPQPKAIHYGKHKTAKYKVVFSSIRRSDHLWSICKTFESLSPSSKRSHNSLKKKNPFAHYRNLITSWTGSAHWEQRSFYAWGWTASMQAKQQNLGRDKCKKGRVYNFFPLEANEKVYQTAELVYVNSTSKGCPAKRVQSKACHLPAPGQSAGEPSPRPALPETELTCNPQTTGTN